MLPWIEEKYVSLLSGRLRNFKRKQNGVFNFSCPLCQDSKTHKHKARGYVLSRKGNTVFYCHNCLVSTSFGRFLKTVDPLLYRDYITESIRERLPVDNTPSIPRTCDKDILAELSPISELRSGDEVRQFVRARKIPESMYGFLYRCDNFMKFTNKYYPGKFSDEALKHDSTRLLIPLFNQEKFCFAYQGRAINDDKVRYITIILDETEPKVWGMDRIDIKKNVFVFEGPIDAMFVENAISPAGGDMVATLASLPIPKENIVICYDNEPHAKHTIGKLEKALNYNYKVVIFPDNFKFKDINDAILGGMNQSVIQWILERNIFEGLAARLRLAAYKRA